MSHFVKCLLPWLLSPRVSSSPPLLASLVGGIHTRRGKEARMFKLSNEKKLESHPLPLLSSQSVLSLSPSLYLCLWLSSWRQVSWSQTRDPTSCIPPCNKAAHRACVSIVVPFPLIHFSFSPNFHGGLALYCFLQIITYYHNCYFLIYDILQNNICYMHLQIMSGIRKTHKLNSTTIWVNINCN